MRLARHTQDLLSSVARPLTVERPRRSPKLGVHRPPGTTPLRLGVLDLSLRATVIRARREQVAQHVFVLVHAGACCVAAPRRTGSGARRPGRPRRALRGRGRRSRSQGSGRAPRVGPMGRRSHPWSNRDLRGPGSPVMENPGPCAVARSRATASASGRGVRRSGCPGRSCCSRHRRCSRCRSCRCPAGG